MLSKKGAKLLEESTEERSYGSISNPGPSTETGAKSKTQKRDFTSSAPAILEPSTDASRPSEPRNEGVLDDSSSPPLDPWKTLVTCSCPESYFRVPISSDDQTNDHADEHQAINERETDVPPTTCSIFISFYKNTAIKLRNSIFIHIFQVLFSLIPLSGIVMGVLYDGKCNEYESLPIYGGLTGIIGLVFTGFWMNISCYCRLGLSSSDMQKLLFMIILMFFLICVILEMIVFGVTAYSFDQHSTNCDKTFYDYTFYKHITTGAFAVVATLLYLPGSLH